MHIGILGAPDNPYVIELQQSVGAHFPRITTQVIRFADLQVGIGDPAIERAAPLGGNIDAPQVDALIVRSMPVGSLEHGGTLSSASPECYCFADLEVGILNWVIRLGSTVGLYRCAAGGRVDCPLDARRFTGTRLFRMDCL